MTGDRGAVHVLLVDDDEGDRFLTGELLRQSPIPVVLRVAVDGLDGLDELRRDDLPRPDLILLDLNMPRMDGHEFLAAMKADDAVNDIPVVVMSSSDRQRDVSLSYQLAAAAYLTKPVGIDRFSEVVDALSDFWFRFASFPRSS